MNERLQRAKELWNQQADWNIHVAIYDNDRTRNEATKEEAFEQAGQRDARRMAWFVQPADRVLDIGCGMGRVMRPLSAHCREVIGVDISETMLQAAEEYLANAPNTRLLQTEGASLQGIDNGSLDFAYSLLCMIHVDRRSAYRYMLELRRVLRPGGLTFLEFQNIQTAEGMRKFGDVLDRDYPLEFYTETELRWLLTQAGLDVISVHHTGEFLQVTAIRGERSQWIREIANGLSVDDVQAQGLFAGDATTTKGSLRATLRSTMARPMTFGPTLTLTQDQPQHRPPLLQADALITLRPGQTHTLEFAADLDQRQIEIRFDEAHARLPEVSLGEPPCAGTLGLHAGLLPPGLYWSNETVSLFPQLFASQQLPFAGT